MKAVQVTGEMTFLGDAGTAKLVIKNSGETPIVIEQIFAGPVAIPVALSVPPRKEVAKEFPCPDGTARFLSPRETTLSIAIAARGVAAPVRVGEIRVHLPTPDAGNANAYFHLGAAAAATMPGGSPDQVMSLSARVAALEESGKEAQFIAFFAVILAAISGGIAMRRK
jgi:hypothetical protein